MRMTTIFSAYRAAIREEYAIARQRGGLNAGFFGIMSDKDALALEFQRRRRQSELFQEALVRYLVDLEDLYEDRSRDLAARARRLAEEAQS